ncbi:hypothetical protein LSTR_LSTR016375 [Laodelphax striatellus]|uniref:Uncharacterized protein n=1 Tax=Laodelphax striatellus TaxID=195883 RepID=A0A482WGR4_LAOST|nr:hypothetical protein LSTR_LSTR016375 [Laodelphax striatellus]
MRPSSRPQNSFKQQVEIVGKFNSGSGNRFPSFEVGQMGFRPTPRHPHRFGGTNTEDRFPTTYSSKTPGFSTSFGDKSPSLTTDFGGNSPKIPSFPTNFGGGLIKSPNFPGSFGESNGFPSKTTSFNTNFGDKTPSFSSHFGDAHKHSPKTPSFPSNSVDLHQFSPSFPSKFGDTNSFSPSYPANSDEDCEKDHHPPMLYPKHAEDLRSRVQFSSNSNFGRQNRQPIGEGNIRNKFKNEQKSYKDIFSKTFENSREFSSGFPSDGRHTNPFFSGFPSEGGSVTGSDVLSGHSGTGNEDFPSGFSGDGGFKSDDFNPKFVGQADDVPKYNEHKKYEGNYASGYFHNAHTYYKLF